MATNNSINNKITNNEFSVGNKNANTIGANLNLLKDRNGGAVQSGDVIGEVNFAGHDGTKHLMPCSGIISTTSGTIGTDRVAANLEFFTHADNTDAAKQRMVISPEGKLTVNEGDDGVSIESLGVNLYANQPGFEAGRTGSSGTGGAFTGDGTIFTMPFQAENYDIDGSYDTATYTFTAPVAGRYLFTGSVAMYDIDSSYDAIKILLVTSVGTNVVRWVKNSGSSSEIADAQSFAVIKLLDDGDTAHVTGQVTGGTLSVRLLGGTFAGELRSFFSAILLG